MMRAIAILVAVALLWPSAAVDTQERSLGKSKPVAASATVYAGSHALLLGVQYSSRAWAPLPAIPKEVESLRLALQSNGFSVTVAAGELTAERIRREVLEFISNFGLDSGNRLLVFFAGHGYTRSDADRDRGYIVPADAPDPERDLRGFLAKAISMDEVNTWAKTIESKHALFVFDSCFSGSIFAARGQPLPRYLAEQFAQPIRQFLTAGTANETVPAESLFAPAFIRAIAGEADGDCDAFVTATELYSWVRKALVDRYRASQTPQFGSIRDPRLDRGEFLFPLQALPAHCGARQTSAPEPQVVEDEFWGAISTSADPAAFQRYLNLVQSRRFSGRYKEAAAARLADLSGSRRSGAPPSPQLEAPPQNLLRYLVALLASSASPETGVAANLELLRYGPKGTEPVRLGRDQLRLYGGDRVAFRISNEGTSNVSTALVFMDSNGRFHPLFPHSGREDESWLGPGKTVTTDRFDVETSTVGTEDVYLLAFENAPLLAQQVADELVKWKPGNPLQPLEQALRGVRDRASAAVASRPPPSRHVVKVVSFFVSAEPLR